MSELSQLDRIEALLVSIDKRMASGAAQAAAKQSSGGAVAADADLDSQWGGRADQEDADGEVLAGRRLKALNEGRVDGSTYQGECACLVGTIANVRGVSYQNLGPLVPNLFRLAESWFLGIRKGSTPENHAMARITRDWIEEWLLSNPDSVNPEAQP